MNITPDLFYAFLKCPTKCWLRAAGEPPGGNPYAEWVRTQNESYRTAETGRLVGGSPSAEVAALPVTENLKDAKWRLATSLPVRAEINSCLVEARIHAIERVPAEARGKAAQFVPIRFIFTNKLGKNDKLLLAFDALVLSAALGRAIPAGKIIHGDDHATLKVKTSALASEVRKRLDKIATLLSSPTPPDLVLNRHCAECEFQARCRQKALETDDLSLLSSMSAKERQKLRSKGIFTVTQLSYTFRPRRRPKRLRDKREKYHHSLKALAIREKKIHIVGTPELKIEGTPVYLDVEGLPDRDFYYLIGVWIGSGESAVQHSLWADTVADEGKIWREFLAIVETVENPVLIHYGSYELTFIKRMKERYNCIHDGSATARAVQSSVNLLSFIFARVYFPTYSNGLKEIAGWLGCTWSETNPSGTSAISLRHNWEQFHAESEKRRLVAYNTQDCIALEPLARSLALMARQPDICSDAELVGAPKTPATLRGKELQRCLTNVLKSAHWIYKQKKISLQTVGNLNPNEADWKVPRKASRSRTLPSNGGKTIRVARKRKCPWHPDHPTLLRDAKRDAEHALLDISFRKSGCKTVLVRYVGRRGYCSHCHTAHSPLAIQRLRGKTFGFGFHALVVYLRVTQRLSIRLISQLVKDLFHETLSLEAIQSFVVNASEAYAGIGGTLFGELCQSAAIHIDETKINILGTQQVVWVLTDGQHVVFHLTPTRESDFLHELLRGYEGTVVSDFYGGYDSLPCRQQKCLVHLIRDLNEDLWKNPFDEEFEGFVAAVRDLLVPILEDVQRFGLKAFHLRKHTRRVERFYRATIDGFASCKEVTANYVKRFVRYKDSLFTFLEHDGVPWNNNAAERAIRHLAVQRKISGSFSTTGAEHYLRLLAIAQTCRFQGKSFLGFLLSELDSVDAYKEKPQRR